MEAHKLRVRTILRILYRRTLPESEGYRNGEEQRNPASVVSPTGRTAGGSAEVGASGLQASWFADLRERVGDGLLEGHRTSLGPRGPESLLAEFRAR